MAVLKIRDALPSFGTWDLVLSCCLGFWKVVRQNGGTGRSVVLVWDCEWNRGLTSRVSEKWRTTCPRSDLMKFAACSPTAGPPPPPPPCDGGAGGQSSRRLRPISNPVPVAFQRLIVEFLHFNSNSIWTTITNTHISSPYCSCLQCICGHDCSNSN